MDLYRLGSLRDEDPDLLADYIGADTITFVEWPDAGEQEIAELGRIARRVKLIHAGGDRRIIEISDGARMRVLAFDTATGADRGRAARRRDRAERLRARVSI